MKGDNAAHPGAAAAAILATLAAAGKHADSVHEAVKLGYITIYDWCDVLDQFREQAGVDRRSRDDE